MHLPWNDNEPETYITEAQCSQPKTFTLNFNSGDLEMIDDLIMVNQSELNKGKRDVNDNVGQESQPVENSEVPYDRDNEEDVHANDDINEEDVHVEADVNVEVVHLELNKGVEEVN